MVPMHITHGTNAIHVTLLYDINAPHTMVQCTSHYGTMHITLWHVIGEKIMTVETVVTIETGVTVETVLTVAQVRQL